MIVVDTTILVLAVGSQHALREPSRRLIEAIGSGIVAATTTPEVVQEFAHVRARRYDRSDAVRLARRYATLLSPLLVVDGDMLEGGLRLFEQHRALGAFDAVLAFAAMTSGSEALVSADTDFQAVRDLRVIEPAGVEFDRLVAD
jgi:predicted nucleic acid-binding protein